MQKWPSIYDLHWKAVPLTKGLDNSVLDENQSLAKYAIGKKDQV